MGRPPQWRLEPSVFFGIALRPNIARLPPALDVIALDLALGRRAGALLAKTRTIDVIDAALALLAADGDSLLTSDAEDLAILAAAAGVHVDIVGV